MGELRDSCKLTQTSDLQAKQPCRHLSKTTLTVPTPPSKERSSTAAAHRDRSEGVWWYTARSSNKPHTTA